MSLYEDEELGAPPTAVSGWSRGAQLMQSQMQLKKAVKGAQATSSTLSGGVGPVSSGSVNVLVNNKNKTGLPVLAPVIDLKSTTKTASAAPATIPDPFFANRKSSKRDKSRAKISDFSGGLLPLNDPQWTAQNEYDPLWPNDYHKIVADMRDSKRNADDNEDHHGKRRYLEGGRDKIRERYNRDDRGDTRGSQNDRELSGFGRRPRGEDDYSDEEDSESGRRSGNRRGGSRRSTGSGAGAAIAPPPSLTETSESLSETDDAEMSAAKIGKSAGLGVAAKIMAKYGYKQGQGLGRSEQGMSQALSVEKTSKRGGRIVHERDRRMLPPKMPPPNTGNQFGESFKNAAQENTQDPATPPSLSQCEEGNENKLFPADTGGEYGEFGSTAGREYGDQSEETIPKPSITELMKNPSKVVLCKNMVGPGEVDDDLEPEVKEECNGKYGDVISVIVFELPNAPVPEEAVRIFIEFKRVESAIKAVIDLNGRFFGGREVKAEFFDQDKFENLILTD